MKNSNTPSSPTETPAVEVLADPIPGEFDAIAIREDYEAAKQGLRRYVAMGLRLIDVKDRLPHGRYLAWCEEHLSDISRAHIHRARSIAEGLLGMVGLKCTPRGTFEELPAEILEIIDGATGYRALLGCIHEFRADEAEQAAEARCREFFAGDPDLADEWEPRVLSGEITWCQAVRGIAGHAATAGKRRKETNYGLLLPTTLTTLNNAFRRWETIPESRRAEVAVSLRTMARDWPEDVRQIIRQAI